MKKQKVNKEKQIIFGEEYTNQSFRDWCEKINKSLKKSGFDENKVEVLGELDQICQNYIKNKTKEIQNQHRLESIDNKKIKSLQRCFV